MPDRNPEDLHINLRHLAEELRRIDVLIRREVLRFQQAGRSPQDSIPGLYVSNIDAEALLARPLGANLADTVTLPAEAHQAFEEAEAQALQTIERTAETAREQGLSLRLHHLASIFGLDRFDLDSLLICLAPGIDLRYQRLYGFLQDDITRRHPTVNMVLDLLCEHRPSRLFMLDRFNEAAMLMRYSLLERVPDQGEHEDSPWLNHRLIADPTILNWLLGSYQPHPRFADIIKLEEPASNETDQVLASGVTALLDRLQDEAALVVFCGTDTASQAAAANLAAARLARPLLTVKLDDLVNRRGTLLQDLRIALRDARLTGAIPFLTGWDACLNNGAPPATLFEELCHYPDTVIVGGRMRWHPSGIARERIVLWHDFGIPAYGERLAIWNRLLADHEVADGVELPELSGQFRLSAGQIRDAVASARDAAAAGQGPITNGALFAAARDHSSPQLGQLARKITPRFGWEDLILPEDQLEILQEITATVRSRPKVLDEWQLGTKIASSSGVTVLFAGPPGTGKTTAAEIIAQELGLDLYKIDLSSVVSKYIGETEKNLGHIFDEASSSNAILFFDEADALFGKRSEVKDSHDRYANLEISYLLQRMESYEGITILATNLRANLDEAFTRRIQFAVDFPFPDEEERLRIWQTLFPDTVPTDESVDLALLASRFRIAGGSIRNIIVHAAYQAAADGGKVTMEHLFHGTRRELQKMGRLIGEGDLTIN